MPAPPRDLIAAYRASPEMDDARRMLGQEPVPVLGGFWGASLAFFLAAWKDSARPEGAGPCLVVTATEEEGDEIQEELETFTPVPVRSFPAWESLFLPDSVPEGDVWRQRLSVTEALSRGAGDGAASFFIVAPVQAVLQPVPPAERLRASKWTLKVGEERSPHSIAEDLVRSGFRHVPLVEARGELSSRGDILDFFPHEAENPLRVELFGDSIESIREFQAETQRSIAGSERETAQVLRLRTGEAFIDCFRGREMLITDLLGPEGRVFVKEPAIVVDRAEKIFRNTLGEDAEAVSAIFFERLSRLRGARVQALPTAPEEPGMNFRFSTVERFRGGDIAQTMKGIADRLASGHAIEIYCESAAETKRFREILSGHGLEPGAGPAALLRVRIGPVRRGFDVASLDLVVLTTRELFNRHVIRRIRRKAAPSRAIQSFLELEKGDYIVHIVHGIGRYLGMESFERNEVHQEFLALEFRDAVKVYVPVSKVDLVQKYIGSGDHAPILDKVGGTSWTKKKEDVETALLDLASDLIDIQALRKERPGFAYPEDSEWQRELEAAFPFDETPDQTEVTAALKADMQAARPMDRLICGDVGYGKTELAMRAAFKAVEAGKQVAVLVPTTVLAQQHFRTFSERMAEFPVRIAVLSRFRSASEQKATVQAAAAGQIDILIGTHRLLSDDIAFRDLGLLVIDEEQRFGVTHKEKLKRLRSVVDVLTLTATPIPRTLHMSLLGIRDISSLTTPPEGRMPVKTEVSRFEPRRVREIVIRELNRDGQVYYVHNRIQDIATVKFQIEKAVPEARVDFAHGQMHERELEEKMVKFFEREIDVLISTTIIESGLDIPNVNTIFIDEADLYGLADLHQLRGRVGRGKHQAYCYLLLPDHRHMNPDAQKRVQALVEFTELGSGFQIAMRDLEIRGAGNILGSAQSGHIASVGYEMYCRLLEKAVRRLRNEPEAEPVQVEIDLTLEARVPGEYAGGESSKLDLYRRISSALKEEQIAELSREIEDRFGLLPVEVERLLDVQRLRVLCAAAEVESIGRDERNLILKGKEGMKKFLATCTRRVAVLDSRTAAVCLVDPARRHPPSIDDERVFRTALEWFRTGVFPELGPGKALRPAREDGIPSRRG